MPKMSIESTKRKRWFVELRKHPKSIFENYETFKILYFIEDYIPEY